jgi:hypothetical protein
MLLCVLIHNHIASGSDIFVPVPWGRAILENVTVAKLVNKFLIFYEHKKFYYHGSPSLDPILSQLNPFHTLSPYLIHTYFNIVLTPTPYVFMIK